jgi:hypothetical protein
VNAKFFSGGESQAKHGKSMEWNIFHCAPEDGGCGSNWSKTTRQGLAKREAQGAETAGLTESAATQRAISMPSDRFRQNYEAIDWAR